MDDARREAGTPEGRRPLFLPSTDPEARRQSLQDLLRAADAGEPEACCLVAELLLAGMLRAAKGSSEERALHLLCRAADDGFIPARCKLNAICERRYRETVASRIEPAAGPAPLTDFAGNVIKIDRKGVFTPVDAALEFRDGKNILTLSVNVNLVIVEEVENEERLLEAVVDGVRAWEGSYRVFGNQALELRVSVTTDARLFDSVNVLPVTRQYGHTLRAAADVFGSKKKREQIGDLLENKRSMAAAGLRWSVYSRKCIFLQSESGLFNEYDEIRAVAKHEFGHVLGLGDLYESPSDSLEGVEKGTYPELDGYCITDRFYNLVMCDHHGPVSNNDIEMVVLAFRENKAQLYQPDQFRGKISTALGRGN